MKKLIIIACLLASINCIAQDKKPIADETEEKETKTTYVISTLVEKFYKSLMNQFPKDFKRVTIVRKKDRHGEYLEYSISFPLTKKREIQNYITKNF